MWTITEIPLGAIKIPQKLTDENKKYVVDFDYFTGWYGIKWKLVELHYAKKIFNEV